MVHPAVEAWLCRPVFRNPEDEEKVQHADDVETIAKPKTNKSFPDP
jgi:hypothetical protein